MNKWSNYWILKELKYSILMFKHNGDNIPQYDLKQGWNEHNDVDDFKKPWEKNIEYVYGLNFVKLNKDKYWEDKDYKFVCIDIDLKKKDKDNNIFFTDEANLIKEKLNKLFDDDNYKNIAITKSKNGGFHLWLYVDKNCKEYLLSNGIRSKKSNFEENEHLGIDLINIDKNCWVQIVEEINWKKLINKDIKPLHIYTNEQLKMILEILYKVLGIEKDKKEKIEQHNGSDNIKNTFNNNWIYDKDENWNIFIKGEIKSGNVNNFIFNNKLQYIAIIEGKEDEFNKGLKKYNSEHLKEFNLEKYKTPKHKVFLKRYEYILKNRKKLKKSEKNEKIECILNYFRNELNLHYYTDNYFVIRNESGNIIQIHENEISNILMDSFGVQIKDLRHYYGYFNNRALKEFLFLNEIDYEKTQTRFTILTNNKHERKYVLDTRDYYLYDYNEFEKENEKRIEVLNNVNFSFQFSNEQLKNIKKYKGDLKKIKQEDCVFDINEYLSKSDLLVSKVIRCWNNKYEKIEEQEGFLVGGLQLFLIQILDRHTKQRFSLFLEGEGNKGKTTFQKFIASLTNKSMKYSFRNTKNTNFENKTIEDDITDKYFLWVGETNKDFKGLTSEIKELTNKEIVETQVKNKNSKKSCFSGALLITSNHTIKWDENDKAINRRFINVDMSEAVFNETEYNELEKNDRKMYENINSYNRDNDLVIKNINEFNWIMFKSLIYLISYCIMKNDEIINYSHLKSKTFLDKNSKRFLDNSIADEFYKEKILGFIKWFFNITPQAENSWDSDTIIEKYVNSTHTDFEDTNKKQYKKINGKDYKARRNITINIFVSSLKKEFDYYIHKSYENKNNITQHNERSLGEKVFKLLKNEPSLIIKITSGERAKVDDFNLYDYDTEKENKKNKKIIIQFKK